MRRPIPLPAIRYLAVYRANLPSPPQDVYIEKQQDLEMSLRSGSIEFSHSVPVTKYKPPAVGVSVAQRRIRLPADSYLLIEVRPQESDPRSALTNAALRVAERVSLFDLRYPQVIAEKLYEGVVDEPGSYMLIAEGPLRITAQPVRDPEAVAAEIRSDAVTLAKLSTGRRERYRLAARWFRRGHEARNLVDRLLFWWVVLEIYPGEGQGQKVVRKTRDLLRERLYPDLAPGTVTFKTRLGRIFGLRGDVVHKGQAFVSPDQQGEFDDHLDRLHAVAVTCLRILAGLQTGDELDKYVRE